MAETNKIIVFANQQGGVGKTTLCMLFANYLAKIGKNVLVVDVDLQHTMRDQRAADEQVFREQQIPYNIQSFDIKDPEKAKQFMATVKKLPGTVLIDAPGNISEDGLLPVFVYADYIICPYQYEGKTISSTSKFVKVMSQIKNLYKSVGSLLFVPNKIDTRVGTAEERKSWLMADSLFAKFGKVSPLIAYRSDMMRINTYSLHKEHEEIVEKSFRFLTEEIYK